MRKIINGKLYDTNTATPIGTWSNNLPTSDFRHETTTLYITKKGNFFIAGESGPLGRYAYSVGNIISRGEGMFALTKEEALDWVEKHLETNKLETKKFEDYFIIDLVEEA